MNAPTRIEPASSQTVAAESAIERAKDALLKMPEDFRAILLAVRNYGGSTHKVIVRVAAERNMHPAELMNKMATTYENLGYGRIPTDAAKSVVAAALERIEPSKGKAVVAPEYIRKEPVRTTADYIAAAKERINSLTDVQRKLAGHILAGKRDVEIATELDLPLDSVPGFKNRLFNTLLINGTELALHEKVAILKEILPDTSSGEPEPTVEEGQSVSESPAAKRAPELPSKPKQQFGWRGRLQAPTLNDEQVLERAKQSQALLPKLSARERTILKFTAEDKEIQEIALAIKSAPNSVLTYKSPAMKKIGIGDLPTPDRLRILKKLDFSVITPVEQVLPSASEGDPVAEQPAPAALNEDAAEGSASCEAAEASDEECDVASSSTAQGLTLVEIEQRANAITHDLDRLRGHAPSVLRAYASGHKDNAIAHDLKIDIAFVKSLKSKAVRRLGLSKLSLEDRVNVLRKAYEMIGPVDSAPNVVTTPRHGMPRELSPPVVTLHEGERAVLQIISSEGKVVTEIVLVGR